MNNLLGRRFGKLVAIRIADKKLNRTAIKWVCKCDCGNISIVDSDNLVLGHTKSCGYKKNHKRISNEQIDNILNYAKLG